MTLDKDLSGLLRCACGAKGFRFAVIGLLMSIAVAAQDKSCVARASVWGFQEYSMKSQVDASGRAGLIQHQPITRTGASQGTSILMANADGPNTATGHEDAFIGLRKRTVNDPEGRINLSTTFRALKVVRDGVNGENGRDNAKWDTAADPARWVDLKAWNGVSCTSTCLSIDVSGHDLGGTIPGVLGSVSVLEEPVLFGDTPSGTIPTDDRYAPLNSDFEEGIDAVDVGPYRKAVTLAVDPVAAQTHQRTAPTNALLPEATGVKLPYRGYDISPVAPTRLRLGNSAPTPAQAAEAKKHAATVKDNDHTARSQTSVTEVHNRLAWDGDTTNRKYGQDAPVAPLIQAEETGGKMPPTYNLEPTLPHGMNFDAEMPTVGSPPVMPPTPRTNADVVEDGLNSAASQGGNDWCAIADTTLTYWVDVEIDTFEFPVPHGGQISFSLTPTPPPGIVFDSTASPPTLMGTPNMAQDIILYTYTIWEEGGVGEGQRLFYCIEVKKGLLLEKPEPKVYYVDRAVSDTLSPAVSGVPPYEYELMGLPSDLSFDEDSLVIHGIPRDVTALSTLTYTVTDAVDSTYSQIFTIEVKADLELLGSVADTLLAYRDSIEVMLPEARGGAGTYAYRLSPDPPGDLRYRPDPPRLSGIATQSIPPTTFVYSVTDSPSGLADSVTFQLEVLLGLGEIGDLVYFTGEDSSYALPEPMGGVEPYHYSFSPDLPHWLEFDAETHILSGTPPGVMDKSEYRYMVADDVDARGEQSFSIAVTANAALIRDRSALIALYDSTGGPQWADTTNWLNPPASVLAFTAEDLGLWHGVEVYGGRVTGVVLPENNLQGTLPDELKYLTALNQLELQHNELTGTIPSALGYVSRLQSLLLHDNSLSGSIPAELGKLTNLEKLHLHNSGLTGEIPTEMGDMAALKQLWLHGNELSGTIPTELGQLDSLQGLLLSDNELNGIIPPALGSLSILEDLWLHDNQLTGAVPPDLGQLNILQRLLLNDNKLSGAIPSGLGELAYLQDLWLHNNRLSGKIPPELGKLDSLQGLLLHNNSITGPIPAALGSLKHLRWLQLQSNELAGPIPDELGRLARLERLELSSNQLTDSIPNSLGGLTGLKHLYVDANRLLGPLPGALVQMSSLEELFFDGPDQEVCAPADEGFLEWLASLGAVRGPVCGLFLTFMAPVSDRSYVAGQPIAEWSLPAVKGGTAPYRYKLHPDLPTGLQFEAATRTVRGIPRDTVSATTYTYTASDGAGNKGQLKFTMMVTPGLTDRFELHGNYPNPFTGTTRLEFSLPQETQISIEVFDLLGRKILEQETPSVPAGAHRHVSLNTANMASGLYLYRVQAVVDGQKVVHSGQMIRL